MRAPLAFAALAVGLVSGTAGTLVHQLWWGLVLGFATAITVLGWLPPGGPRVAFALGWCLPVARGVLEPPGGGVLVSDDAAGWSLVVGSAVLLLAALVTAGGSRRTHAGAGGPSGEGRADDPGVRGLPS